MWPQPDIWVLRSLADLRVRGEEGGYTYPLKFFLKVQCNYMSFIRRQFNLQFL